MFYGFCDVCGQFCRKKQPVLRCFTCDKRCHSKCVRVSYRDFLKLSKGKFLFVKHECLCKS